MNSNLLQLVTVGLLLGLPLIGLFAEPIVNRFISLKIWSWIIRLAAFIFFSVIAIIVWPNVHLSRTEWYDRIEWKIALTYLFVLLGMLQAELIKSFIARNSKIDELQKQGIETQVPFGLDWRNMVSCIGIALFPYFGVLAMTINSALSMATVLLSVQTGFYWRDTLAKKSWKDAVKAVRSMGK